METPAVMRPPRTDSQSNLECSPADGTSAAARVRGFRQVPPAALIRLHLLVHERKGHALVRGSDEEHRPPGLEIVHRFGNYADFLGKAVEQIECG